MLPPLDIIQRLVLASVLGAIVGVERERLERAAGLRTHALVGVGAALFMIVSAFGFGDVLSTPQVGLDPSRIAAQVVSGIGFLGAGTIIFQREIVRGLTTAASIWAVAAVGLAVGGGLYLAAVVATVLVLLILAGLKPIENRFFLHRRSRLLTLVVARHEPALTGIEAAVDAVGLRLVRLLIEPGQGPDEDRFDLTLSGGQRDAIDRLIDRLRVVPGVRRISSVRIVAEGEDGQGDDAEVRASDTPGTDPGVGQRR
jgi:putative Mg2+ transporter-C (MgtC) family protein